MKRRRFSEFRPMRPVKMSGERVIAGAGVKYLNPCVQSRGECPTKLVFITPGDAKKLNVRPGPALQYCEGKKPGMVLPVDSPRQATEFAKKYCSCVRHGGSAAACESNIPAAFKGYGRHRRKRR